MYVTLVGAAIASWGLVRCTSTRVREPEVAQGGAETAATGTAATTDPPSAHAGDPAQSAATSSPSLGASAASDGAAMGPAALMQEIRADVKSNPRLAERLAREHRQLYPDSADADERDAFLVASIFNQRRFDRAHVEASNYLKQHPNGRFADYVKKLAGMSDEPAP